MSRTSYGNAPKGPNKGTAGKPNTFQPKVSPTAKTVNHVETTPDRQQHKPIYTQGTKAGNNKPSNGNPPKGGF